jgi:protein pelota
MAPHQNRLSTIDFLSSHLHNHSFHIFLPSLACSLRYMKLLKRSISVKDGDGYLLVRPDTPEDLWHLYNLCQVGDELRCSTFRKVTKGSSTGSTSSQKKRTMLTIRLQHLDFDGESLELRMSGITTQESDVCKLGSHHTLTLELHQNLRIAKDCWDQMYLDIIEDAIHPERQAQVAAMVMQATGLAHLCLVTGALTITKARIDVNIPKKRTGYTSQQTKANTKFLEAMYQAILRHVDFSQIKCVVLASPGFVKDDFYQYLLQESVRRDDRVLIEHKSKFVLCHASSGHKHALEEVFANPQILHQLTETKVAREVQVLQQFMRMLDTQPDRAVYGIRHVQQAQEQLAIDQLLLTDELFRNANVPTRRLYVTLVEQVRANGGQVHVFSSMHVSGQQLQQVSGVAAILRFPIPDLMDDDEEEGNDEGDEGDDNEPEEEYDPNRRIQEDLADMGF